MNHTDELLTGLGKLLVLNMRIQKRQTSILTGEYKKRFVIRGITEDERDIALNLRGFRSTRLDPDSERYCWIDDFRFEKQADGSCQPCGRRMNIEELRLEELQVIERHVERAQEISDWMVSMNQMKNQSPEDNPLGNE